MVQFVARFAPSPNGRLHLGHAYSALLNQQMAREAGGRFLVRIEDIDQERCTPINISHALEDLRWLGLEFEEPVLMQSQRMGAYREAIHSLFEQELLYVCTCTRSQIARLAATTCQTTCDPDGQPLYPGSCRHLAQIFENGSALRLRTADAMRRVEMLAGPLHWNEMGGRVPANPVAWGDVLIARKNIGTSYHLACVVDDAFQGISHIVRGKDLYQATSIHRLLQVLLDLPEPTYHHHNLILHESGRKLAKSKLDESIADLRTRGYSAFDIRQQLGFD